jgi:hypothetical protein
MTVTHTPGPWSICDDGTEDEPMLKVVGRTARHEIALCCTGAVPQEEETANARLIAAAPEMLATLRTALNWIDPDSDPVPLTNRKVCEKIRTVIAMAGGAP